MDSSLVAGINSSLHHLTSLSNNKPDAMVCELRIGLRNLKVLLVCLQKVCGDYTRLLKSSSSLGDLASFVCIRKLESTSLLSKIRQVVQRVLLQSELSSYELSSIGDEIHKLAKQAADEWRNHMKHTSRLLTVDEVVCFADSSLDSTLDFLAFVRGIMSHEILSIDRELVSVFEVQITFLKSVLLFLMQTGATRNRMQNLVNHVQSFAIDAACIFVKDDHPFYKDKWIEKVQTKCSMVNCMAADSHVYQAYAQALSPSRFYTRFFLVGGDFLSTCKNFLDSLISLLWNVLRHSDHRSDQLKVLYERLRFSRSSLKQLPQNFVHKKIRDRIRVMLCHVGVVICSIHQPGVETSNVLASLLQRFDTLQEEIEISVPQTCNSSKAHELGLGVSDFRSFIEDLEISEGSEKDPKL